MQQTGIAGNGVKLFLRETTNLYIFASWGITNAVVKRNPRKNLAAHCHSPVEQRGLTYSCKTNSSAVFRWCGDAYVDAATIYQVCSNRIGHTWTVFRLEQKTFGANDLRMLMRSGLHAHVASKDVQRSFSCQQMQASDHTPGAKSLQA